MQKIVKEFMALKTAMSRKNDSLPDFQMLSGAIEKLEHLLVLQSYFKVNETKKQLKDYEKNYFKQYFIRLEPTQVASFLLGNIDSVASQPPKPHSQISDCVALQED